MDSRPTITIVAPSLALGAVAVHAEILTAALSGRVAVVVTGLNLGINLGGRNSVSNKSVFFRHRELNMGCGGRGRTKTFLISFHSEVQ